MATLCTELGMPKYRENKKKRKRFLPGNIPANICRTQFLVRVWRCLCALQRAPPACIAAHSLLDVGDTSWRRVRACASVYTTAQTCVLVWFRLSVCSVFFMWTQSFLYSFPAHFSPSVLCGCASAFYAYTHRFLIERVPAGVSGFVCVLAPPRALQQRAIRVSNGSCSHFTNQPSFLLLYASGSSQRGPSHISHWKDSRRV